MLTLGTGSPLHTHSIRFYFDCSNNDIVLANTLGESSFALEGRSLSKSVFNTGEGEQSIWLPPDAPLPVWRIRLPPPPASLPPPRWHIRSPAILQRLA